MKRAMQKQLNLSLSKLLLGFLFVFWLPSYSQKKEIQ